MKSKLRYKQAREIAAEVCKLLAPACERAAVAGSVRRQRAQVGDIEIAYVSRTESVKVGFWDVEEVLLSEERIQELVQAGVWRFDEKLPRNGPKYKRLRWGRNGDGPVIELFRAEPENWGLIYALRTGSAEFMHAIVTPQHLMRSGHLRKGDLALMPDGMWMKDGRLWTMGEGVGRIQLITATEEEFFAAVGLPVFPPEEREIGTLGAWAIEQGMI